MKQKLLSSVLLGITSCCVFADQSIYCPQNHAYIRTGMTMDQVIASCGQPLSQEQSNQPLMQKIPVQQLIYNNKGTGSGFYGVWNLSTGDGGAQVQIDVVNNTVKNIKLNGSNNNAFSLCDGSSIEVGDPVSKVYSACGSPSATNSTFTKVSASEQKPLIWVYQFSQYQPKVSLTFVNGKLQSINN